MSWRPTTDFEEEIMSIQPEHDLIFSDHGRNPESLAASVLDMEDDIKKIFHENGESPRIPQGKSKELHMVSKIRQMMPQNRHVGRRLTEDDLEDDVDREAETIAMIRNSGSAPCIDVPLASKDTLPTIVPNEGYKISNGHPIFLDSEFFKLKPRNSGSEASVSKTFDVSSGSSDSSLYTQFKTLDFNDTDDVEKYADKEIPYEQLKNTKSTSSSPSVHENRTRSRKNAKVEGKHRKHKELTASDIENNNAVKSNSFSSNKTFLTPKELYMRKRAGKS